MNPNYIVWAFMAATFACLIGMAVFFIKDAYREGEE